MAEHDDSESDRPRQYTLTPFRLDVAAGLLYRGGEGVPLPHRAVELLLRLSAVSRTKAHAMG